MPEVDKSYQELQSWASDLDDPEVKGNLPKDELVEKYREIELEENDDHSDSEGDQDSINAVGNLEGADTADNPSTSTNDKEELQESFSPERKAPEGETAFNHQEIDTDEEEEITGEEPEETDQEDEDQDDSSGVEEESGIGVQTAKQFHAAINDLSRFGAKEFLGLKIPKFDEKQLDKLAKSTKDSFDMLIPASWKGRSGKGTALLNCISPHLLAFRDAEKIEEQEDDEEDEEQEEATTVEKTGQTTDTPTGAIQTKEG